MASSRRFPAFRMLTIWSRPRYYYFKRLHDEEVTYTYFMWNTLMDDRPPEYVRITIRYDSSLANRRQADMCHKVEVAGNKSYPSMLTLNLSSSHSWFTCKLSDKASPSYQIKPKLARNSSSASTPVCNRLTSPWIFSDDSKYLKNVSEMASHPNLPSFKVLESPIATFALVTTILQSAYFIFVYVVLLICLRRPVIHEQKSSDVLKNHTLSHVITWRWHSYDVEDIYIEDISTLPSLFKLNNLNCQTAVKDTYALIAILQYC